MPLFLDRDQLYDTIQRELPEDVYPHGDPQAFMSTKESFASARVLEDAYAVLRRVWVNFFPQDADEEITKHEVAHLGAVQDASQSLDDRRAAVLAQMRDQSSCSRWDLLMRAVAFLPAGTPARILGWAEIYAGGWELGARGLGFDTYLGGFEQPMLESEATYREYAVDQPDVAMLPWDGAPAMPWATAQQIAYTYELRIYGYTLSAAERAKLDELLSRNEYGRDAHVIRDGLALAGEALLAPLDAVSQLINKKAGYPAVYSDDASPTGYKGWGTYDG